MSKTKKQQAYQWGHWAEIFSMIALWLKGYRILKRRFKTKYGEIDLVAKRGSLLVFVEVKARQDFEKGACAIHSKNRRRVEKASQFFIQTHTRLQNCEIRYDAMIVSPFSYPKHIKRAWIFGE